MGSVWTLIAVPGSLWRGFRGLLIVWSTGAAFQQSDYNSQINERDNNHKLCVSPPLSGGVVTWQRGAGIICIICLVMDDDQAGGPGPVTLLVTIAVRKLGLSIITDHWVQSFFLSCFCHHLWWWSPVTLHTIHRQHAGEIPSLGPKLRSEYRRSSWKCMFQLINITIIKIKEVYAVLFVGWYLWQWVHDPIPAPKLYNGT